MDSVPKKSQRSRSVATFTAKSRSGGSLDSSSHSSTASVRSTFKRSHSYFGKVFREEAEKVFFLVPRKVSICYGPYFHLGVLDYRLERLHGLTRTLKKCGAALTLKPDFLINEVRVWHLERNIFSCRLTDLQHGGDGDLDRLCMDAGRAFEKSIRNAYVYLCMRYKYETSVLKTGCPCPQEHEDPAFSYYEKPQPPTPVSRKSRSNPRYSVIRPSVAGRSGASRMSVARKGGASRMSVARKGGASRMSVARRGRSVSVKRKAGNNQHHTQSGIQRPRSASNTSGRKSDQAEAVKTIDHDATVFPTETF